MSIDSAITTVMKRKLELLGYPSSEIQYSLGYCQGDGASFTGKLDLKAIGARLLPGVKPEVWASCICDLEITRDRGFRYVHENSTSLSETTETIASGDPAEFGGVAQKYALGQLVGLLKEDIIRTGAALGRDGYAVMESYFRSDESESVWCFDTDNFRVECFKLADEFFAPDDLSEEEYLDGCIADLLSGDFEVYGSRVVVSLLDEDREPSYTLAQCDTWGHFHKKSDGALGGPASRRELVSEAIHVAREKFEKIRLPSLKAA
ncbi:hypothetical protein ACRCPS_18365 [Pseudomonas aeruginosa]